MNPFVNYQQRGIELPPGCKDLIDTLRTQKTVGPAATRIPAGGLQDIPNYVARLLQSKARGRHLVISSTVPFAAVVLKFGRFLMGHHPSGLSALIFTDSTEPLQEQMVRTVFEQVGFSPFMEYGVGGGVEPTRTLCYPLPDTATEAASLVTAVFQKGFGVSEHARLEFGYYEWD